MLFRPPYPPGSHLENRLATACVIAGITLAAILVIKIFLPWLVGAGLVAIGVWFWRRHQAQRRALHLLFYDQLTARQGRISVLEFAMAAQLTGAEARTFLDARAQEFFANFEPTDGGDVLYTFHTPAATAGSATGARVGAKPPMLRLTSAALAQRLSCSEQELVAQRQDPGFNQWSRQRDPDSCGWAYDAGGDCYWPRAED